MALTVTAVNDNPHHLYKIEPEKQPYQLLNYDCNVLCFSITSFFKQSLLSRWSLPWITLWYPYESLIPPAYLNFPHIGLGETDLQKLISEAAAVRSVVRDSQALTGAEVRGAQATCLTCFQFSWGHLGPKPGLLQVNHLFLMYSPIKIQILEYILPKQTTTTTTKYNLSVVELSVEEAFDFLWFFCLFF